MGARVRVIKYAAVGVASAILFGVMDGLINANPLAEELLEFYSPIRRTSVDVLAGVMIDLAYGFILAGMFLMLYRSLPGHRGLFKGASFALIVWFFRVVMYTVSQWVMLRVPVEALVYSLFTGLGEMLVLGILYGSTLRPSA